MWGYTIMCGIAGFIDYKISYDSKEIASRMGEAIRSRGPDDSGVWQDVNCGVNLIHRRLAILDLTPAGHQPMLSPCGRFVMVFNGEVYNFTTLRKELESFFKAPISWRGHSDSEVILQGFALWGVEATLQKCEGMFAIALWDRETRELYLIRDRLGEKPLYYGYFNGVFAFASELKALKAHPKFNPEINRNALGQQMLHNCIPAPLSIYQDIYKLLPGHYLKLSYSDFLNEAAITPVAYWSLAQQKQRYTGSLEDAVLELEKLLSGVIKDQMIADVPLGCFLSGGVDSSAITALMQAQSHTPIKTFSIGFEHPEYDEAIYAKAVAAHLGTDHTELYVTDKDALNVIPSLSQIYDEPFSDSSQIPTYLVCKLAKQQVTVALSGDAGDELFAGYNRYLLTSSVRAKVNKIPLMLREPLAKLSVLSTPRMLAMLNSVFKLPIANFSDKTYKLASLLRAKSFDEFYLALTAHWLNYSQLVIGCDLSSSLWDKAHPQMNEIEAMQFMDTLGYLPDDILVKVDRAAMANSLETRVPFLNHRVVEFANSLPLSYKINNGISKYILREVLYKHIPQSLIERPKRGFAIPIQQWLRGELREWAQDLLSPTTLKQQGYFNVELVQQKIKDHMSSRADNGYYLWDVLMFQQWLASGNLVATQ